MFGDQEGNLLIMSKVLYGLRFNELLAKKLYLLGFVSLKYEADV